MKKLIFILLLPVWLTCHGQSVFSDSSYMQVKWSLGIPKTGDYALVTGRSPIASIFMYEGDTCYLYRVDTNSRTLYSKRPLPAFPGLDGLTEADTSTYFMYAGNTIWKYSLAREKAVSLRRFDSLSIFNLSYDTNKGNLTAIGQMSGNVKLDGRTLYNKNSYDGHYHYIFMRLSPSGEILVYHQFLLDGHAQDGSFINHHSSGETSVVINTCILRGADHHDINLLYFGRKGTLVWHRQLKGISDLAWMAGTSLLSGPTGEIYLAGSQDEGIRDFPKPEKKPKKQVIDPETGETYEEDYDNGKMGFIACYSIAGDLKWVHNTETGIIRLFHAGKDSLLAVITPYASQNGSFANYLCTTPKGRLYKLKGGGDGWNPGVITTRQVEGDRAYFRTSFATSYIYDADEEQKKITLSLYYCRLQF